MFVQDFLKLLIKVKNDSCFVPREENNLAYELISYVLVHNCSLFCIDCFLSFIIPIILNDINQ